MDGKMCKFLIVERIDNNQELGGGRFKKPPFQVKICSLKPNKTRRVCDHVDSMGTCSNFQGLK